jgi:hypothetical protein
MKIAILTVNYGNYDSFKEPKNLKNTEIFDWYYFTDNNKIESKIYKVVVEPYHIKEFTHTDKKVYYSKYYKMQHHKIDILADYNYIIWIDASFQILNVNFVDDVLKLINQKSDQDILLMGHRYHKYR